MRTGIVKIKCVGLVATTKTRVVKVVPWGLAHRLRIGVVVLLIVAHVIHVVIWVRGVVLIPLTGVLEFSYFESLLNEDILDIVRQIVYFVFRLVFFVLFLFRLFDKFAFQVLYFDLIEKAEL